jgi:arginase
VGTRTIAVLDAPSNLGLKPPEEGSVPGVYKLAGALRDQALLARLGATDAGVATPPRYRSAWQPGLGARNATAIADYTLQLGERIGGLIDDSRLPLVLGGDCSILLAAMLALRKRGRFGLAYLDGHSDFRHPGNAAAVGAVGGEALAVATGRGDHRLIDLDGCCPYVRESDVVALGMRVDDEYLVDLSSLGIRHWTSRDIHDLGAGSVVEAATSVCARAQVDGFWIHVDVDILDPSVMPAVDSPDPGGLDYTELGELLRGLVAHEQAIGLDVCIFDPDLDPDGSHASRLADLLIGVLNM